VDICTSYPVKQRIFPKTT